LVIQIGLTMRAHIIREIKTNKKISLTQGNLSTVSVPIVT